MVRLENHTLTERWDVLQDESTETQSGGLAHCFHRHENAGVIQVLIKAFHHDLQLPSSN
jgi:hypothetical protein